jgi:hypothetical protein
MAYDERRIDQSTSATQPGWSKTRSDTAEEATMNRPTRALTVLTVVLVTAVLSAAPAFARIYPEPTHGGAPAPAPPDGGGLALWIILVVAVGGAVLVGLGVAALSVTLRHRRAAAPTPA